MGVKKKPTIKELTNVVLELNQRINAVYHMVQDLEKGFSLYIELKKDGKKFSNYIDKKVKEWKEAEENDSKTDGKADKPNLQGDTDGESSGSKRVRKKAK
jgi:hypothetical protein